MESGGKGETFQRTEYYMIEVKNEKGTGVGIGVNVKVGKLEFGGTGV